MPAHRRATLSDRRVGRVAKVRAKMNGERHDQPFMGGHARLVIGRLTPPMLSCPAPAQETTDEGTIDPAAAETLFPKPGYSPYAGNTFPTRPLFGDTHLHTSQSFDAIAFGNSLGPEEAYRFARGEEVISSTGQRARLSRPLDFLVVADHAENMGTMGEIKAGNPGLDGRP